MTGLNRLTLSHSQIATWRACPAKWGFRYAEGLRPVTDAPALVRGRAFHAGLAAGYAAWHLADPDAITNAAVAAVRAGDGPPDALAVDESMVRQHFAATRADVDRMTPVWVEEPFEVPVVDAGGRANGLYLRGYFDLVAWDRRYDELVVHEHKSTAGAVIGGIGSRIDLDPQTAGYVYALRWLLRNGVLDAPLKRIGAAVGRKRAEELTGHVTVNVTRRKVPAEPRVLNDGTVSLAPCDTTYDRLAAALAAQDERVREGAAPVWLHRARAELAKGRTDARVERHQEAVERWREVRMRQQQRLQDLEHANTFFHRYDHRRTEEELERWREEVWVDAARIRLAEREPRQRTRNTGHCATRTCEFHDVCYRPDDLSVRQAQFRVRADDAKAEPGAEPPALDLGF